MIKTAPVIIVKKHRHISSTPTENESKIQNGNIPVEKPSSPESPIVVNPRKKSRYPSQEYINACRKKVMAIFPLLWKDDVVRPLKVGITRDVIEYLATHPDADLSISEWRCAVRGLTLRWVYLEKLSVPGTVRYDLNGEPAGTVSASEAAYAESCLAKRKAKKTLKKN